MNIPLMKTRGNLTIADSIIIVLGMLVGAAEKIRPREERQKAPRIIANAKITGREIVIPRARLTIIGISDIASPNIKEASMSPNIIVGAVTGDDISLSSVLACVSQGATAGEMEVAVKNRTMLSRPGIMKSRLRSLPTMKVTKRNIGNRIPNITTGPFE
jgi:hypothetical protein